MYTKDTPAQATPNGFHEAVDDYLAYCEGGMTSRDTGAKASPSKKAR